MLAQLTASSAVPETFNAVHQLVLLPKGKTLPHDVPHRDLLAAVLKRRGMKADHIPAARFLKRFLEHDVPWRHVDLSASRCEGGLGSVAGEVAGFGVGWALRMRQGR